MNIPATLLNGPDTRHESLEPRISLMSAPATRRKRIGQLELSVSEPRLARTESTTAVEGAGCRRQQIPLGILHVNREWKVLEYRDRYEEYRDHCEQDDDLPPVNALGKHLFSIAPWIRHPDFIRTITTAIRAGIANSHFDFKVRLSVKSAERAIHVNVFMLGDTTAWLFISDKSLPI
jgi:hypothetical protein